MLYISTSFTSHKNKHYVAPASPRQTKYSVFCHLIVTSIAVSLSHIRTISLWPWALCAQQTSIGTNTRSPVPHLHFIMANTSNFSCCWSPLLYCGSVSEKPHTWKWVFDRSRAHNELQHIRGPPPPPVYTCPREMRFGIRSERRGARNAHWHLEIGYTYLDE